MPKTVLDGHRMCFQSCNTSHHSISSYMRIVLIGAVSYVAAPAVLRDCSIAVVDRKGEAVRILSRAGTLIAADARVGTPGAAECAPGPVGKISLKRGGNGCRALARGDISVSTATTETFQPFQPKSLSADRTVRTVGTAGSLFPSSVSSSTFYRFPSHAVSWCMPI